MKLLDFINEKTNNAYNAYKLVSVIFDKESKSCTFKFLYQNEINDKDKIILKDLIKEYLNQDIEIIIKCKKAYVDEDLVRTIVYNYYLKNFPSISADFDKKNILVDISEEINIVVNCNDFQYKFLNSSNNKQEVLDYLDNFFFEDIIYDLKNVFDNPEIDVLEENINLTFLNNFYEKSNKKFKGLKVDKIQNKIGEVQGNPFAIGNINSALECVEVAGEVLFLNEKSFETKRKDADGNPIRKTFYSFTLKDYSGRINCVYFPLKADLQKVPTILQEGLKIIVAGDVEEFNGRLSFKVKSWALCEIIEEFEEEEVVEVKKEPNKNYIFIKPEPYIEITQDNLFAVATDVGDYLKTNEVVVFDIETTGFEATKCEILEIGAVKLREGKIVETFEALICPQNPIIPDEIIKLTGITYDMVKDCPTIAQVMPDFYKFCYGSTIIAYNIDFDYKFISVYGKKFGIEFDMKQIDAMYLARAFIPGLKNFKLGSVCKKLGVSLENAHRAVHDAMATAEVVIKLGPHIT